MQKNKKKCQKHKFKIYRGSLASQRKNSGAKNNNRNNDKERIKIVYIIFFFKSIKINLFFVKFNRFNLVLSAIYIPEPS